MRVPETGRFGSARSGNGQWWQTVEGRKYIGGAIESYRFVIGRSWIYVLNIIIIMIKYILNIIIITIKMSDKSSFSHDKEN